MCVKATRCTEHHWIVHINMVGFRPCEFHCNKNKWVRLLTGRRVCRRLVLQGCGAGRWAAAGGTRGTRQATEGLGFVSLVKFSCGPGLCPILQGTNRHSWGGPSSLYWRAERLSQEERLGRAVRGIIWELRVTAAVLRIPTLVPTHCDLGKSLHFPEPQLSHL